MIHVFRENEEQLLKVKLCLIYITEWITLYLHILFFKSLGSLRFFIYLFESVLCSPRMHLFDQKYSKNSTIVKYVLLQFKIILSILKCNLFP